MRNRCATSGTHSPRIFPDWFVTGNLCVNWERGNDTLYRAPDVFVVPGPVETGDPRVYLLWQDPPIAFAVEVGSRSPFHADEGPKRKPACARKRRSA